MQGYTVYKDQFRYPILHQRAFYPEQVFESDCQGGI